MKNKKSKKTFFRIFLTLNISITIIFFLIVITILFFFKSNLNVFDTNNYSKLIISNISLKLDSIMKNYVNRSIFNGIAIGPIIDMNGEKTESKTKIQGLFYEIESNDDTIDVNYIYEGIHYVLSFNKLKLLEHLLEEYYISEDFFFTNKKGEFLIGNKNLYDDINNSKISVRKEIEDYNASYIFYYDFEDFGINFFMKRYTVLQKLLLNNIALFISIFLGILLLSIPISLIISSYLRKDISNSIVALIKGISKNDLNYIQESDIEEINYYLREIKDVIEVKFNTYEGIQASLNEMGYLYELSIKHNSLLIEIIGFIKSMLNQDFDVKNLDNKINALEKNKNYEKIDSEFYTILKKDLLEIYESIKSIKNNKK